MCVEVSLLKMSLTGFCCGPPSDQKFSCPPTEKIKFCIFLPNNQDFAESKKILYSHKRSEAVFCFIAELSQAPQDWKPPAKFAQEAVVTDASSIKNITKLVPCF